MQCALCKQYRYDASDLYTVAYMKKNLWLTCKCVSFGAGPLVFDRSFKKNELASS